MRLSAVAFVLVLASCVTNPQSGTSIAPGSASVSFQGVALYQPGLRVRVEMQEPVSGMFTQLAVANVAPNGAWSALVPVPARAWWIPPCGTARFRFRATNGRPVQGLDAACLRAAGPSPTLDQTAACLVPYVDIFRGQVHVGDLALTGQAEADAYACVTVVDGDLSAEGEVIVSGPGFAQGVTFSMPRLEEVTGDLAIDGGRTQAFALPRLERVGGDLTMLSTQFLAFPFPFNPADPPVLAVTSFGLPALVEVGGGVGLTTASAGSLGGSGSVQHDFELDALTSVGTDVSIHNPVFPAAVQGLRALTEIPRDLVFDWGVTDLDSEELLPALVSVGRDASFVLPPNAREALASLESVGRNMAVSSASNGDARLGPNLLPALRSIDGDLDATDVSVGFLCGATVLAGLEEVTGTLRFAGGRPEAALGATGLTHLTLGGLELTGTTTAFVPLHDDATVPGTGAVSFTDNTALCPCQIDASAAGLALRGWTGTLVSSGNGAAATCAPCPPAGCP